MTTTDKTILQGRIAGAYEDLASAPGRFVKIRQIREHLADIARADLDAILIEMYKQQIINLIPQSNQRALTAEDRAAAIRCGGEHKHRFAWN